MSDVKQDKSLRLAIGLAIVFCLLIGYSYHYNEDAEKKAKAKVTEEYLGQPQETTFAGTVVTNDLILTSDNQLASVPGLEFPKGTRVLVTKTDVNGKITYFVEEE